MLLVFENIIVSFPKVKNNLLKMYLLQKGSFEYIVNKKDTNTLLIRYPAPDYYYFFLKNIYYNKHVKHAPLGLCIDPCLCRFINNKAKFAIYDTAGIRVMDAGRCNVVKRELKLKLVYFNQVPTINWELGPYKKGMYQILISIDGVFPTSAYVLPLKGYVIFNRSIFKKVIMWLKYTSPEGWVTYSDKFVLKLDRDNAILWNR